MTEAEARARLEQMTAWDSAPALTSTEVDELLALARRSDTSGTPAVLDTWAAGTRYIEGQQVRPSTGNDHRYTVTASGTTDASEPDWPTDDGGTVVDGSVTWQESGTDYWVPTWDLRSAAAEGWRWKAGKAAGGYSFGTDGQSFQRQQIVDHCERMAKIYDGGSAFTVRATA